MDVLKQLIKEYGNDPLYLAILKAKTSEESILAIDTFKAIRGNKTYNNFKNKCKYLTLLKG